MSTNLHPDEVLKNLHEKQKRKKLYSKVRTARITLLVVGVLNTVVGIYFIYGFYQAYNSASPLLPELMVSSIWYILLPVAYGVGLIVASFIINSKPMVGLSLGLVIYLLPLLINLIASGNFSGMQGWLINILVTYLIVRGIASVKNLPEEKADIFEDTIDNF